MSELVGEVEMWECEKVGHVGKNQDVLKSKLLLMAFKAFFSFPNL